MGCDAKLYSLPPKKITVREKQACYCDVMKPLYTSISDTFSGVLLKRRNRGFLALFFIV